MSTTFDNLDNQFYDYYPTQQYEDFKNAQLISKGVDIIADPTITSAQKIKYLVITVIIIIILLIIVAIITFMRRGNDTVTIDQSQVLP